MALTDDQKQAIITQRLQGAPVTTVMAVTGHARQTVISVYRDYLASVSHDRSDEVEALRLSLVFRHEQSAFVAKMEAERSRQDGDRAAHTRYLKEERDSLREIARLTGAESAVKVDVSGQVDVTLHDEREQLAEYVAGLCQSLN